jgi:2,3-bisphosphoglycerate-independent phosphoglycerate mutase
VNQAKANGRYVHLLALCSDAGVHALLDHLYACVELCKRLGQPKVAVHALTDGRDTGPFTGKGFLDQVQSKLAQIGVGGIASVCGRYYAMDRDNRWERVNRAYDMLTGRGDGVPHFATAAQAVQEYYDHPTNTSQKGDEFITPRTVGDVVAATRIQDGDAVIFVNFRGDRPREITRAFRMVDFEGHVKPSPDSGRKGFDRGRRLDLAYVTMTAYDQSLSDIVKVAYHKPPKMADIGGQYLAKKSLRQFRCAETEKFPHVTFFFNDYREEPFPGESREMAQSPKVATYDLQPQMSALEVCRYVIERLHRQDCEDFILVNFANGDMVGHTGSLPAAIKAVETVDACVGQIVDSALARGGKVIVTADHGNAEQMWDPQTGSPHTAHTTYDVECILVDPDLRSHATGSPDKPSPRLASNRRLADIFPTILELMGLEKPEAMEGVSLLQDR